MSTSHARIPDGTPPGKLAKTELHRLFIDRYRPYSETYGKTVHPFPVAILYRPSVILTDGAYYGKPESVAFRFLGRPVETVEDEPCV